VCRELFERAPDAPVSGRTAWTGRPVVVAGAGVSGEAAARALVARGAQVTIADGHEAPLAALPGVPVRALAAPPPGTTLVVTSPGWRPDAPLLVAAAAAGIEVVGEVELAWWLAREVGAPAPWLAVTGTNGKTTTVRMLAAILSAAGRDAVAAGNVGLALVDAVLAGHEVLAVELSSFQLHWSRSLDPHSATVLNLAPDHLDWHGSLAAYGRDKARIFGRATRALVPLDEPAAAALVASRPGAPPDVGLTTGEPGPGQVGVLDGVLLDRAFAGEPTPLAHADDVPVAGPHGLSDAVAAAALARSYGVPAGAVRDGLVSFVPDGHRHALVATASGVRYVDDSKATNPHAAAASLAAQAPVVWLAGGLLKGADVDDLVRQAAPRLRAVVLLGTDQEPFAQALARHAPEVPVRRVARLDTGAMTTAVDVAAALARNGDTVLLAPAAASMDCFRDYRERGALFAERVLALPGAHTA